MKKVFIMVLLCLVFNLQCHKIVNVVNNITTTNKPAYRQEDNQTDQTQRQQ